MSSEATTNPYPLPHDASEKTRLDTQHFAFKYYLGGNVAPEISLQLATQILDVGTGSGRWVVEVAEECPNARVTGIDLAYPIFEEVLPPANTAFVVGDVTRGIIFPDESVDLVHSRLCLQGGAKCRLVQGGITADQWPSYFKDVLRVLKSGSGWIQVTEPRSEPLLAVNGSFPRDSAFREVSPLYCELY
jgi:ubiquinone/menaquinone biosynthesis C-methylase UbiE